MYFRASILSNDKKEWHRADKPLEKVLTYSSAEQHGGIVEVVHKTVYHQSKVPHTQRTMFLNTRKDIKFSIWFLLYKSFFLYSYLEIIETVKEDLACCSPLVPSTPREKFPRHQNHKQWDIEKYIVQAWIRHGLVTWMFSVYDDIMIYRISCSTF